MASTFQVQPGHRALLTQLISRLPCALTASALRALKQASSLVSFLIFLRSRLCSTQTILTPPSRFPTYSCKAADELNCSEVSITPILKGINIFCLILLSLYDGSCSCVLPRRKPCTAPLKHLQQKRPEETGTKAGAQPKDTGREEPHKPNAKRFISAVSLRDNCDRRPSAAHTIVHSQLGQGSASPETPQVGTSPASMGNSHTCHSTAPLCFASHTARFYPASRGWW